VPLFLRDLLPKIAFERGSEGGPLGRAPIDKAPAPDLCLLLLGPELGILLAGEGLADRRIALAPDPRLPLQIAALLMLAMCCSRCSPQLRVEQNWSKKYNGERFRSMPKPAKLLA
jgi:hypothetical protein